MGSKFGKREKIVLGVVLGIVAILALHFMIFQSKGRDVSAARMEAVRAQSEAQNYANTPKPDDIENLAENVTRQEKAFWKGVLENNLLMDPLIFMGAEPTPPPADSDEDVRKQYREALAKHEERVLFRDEAMIESVMMRIERLAEMKQRFEAGESWDGSSLSTTGSMSVEFGFLDPMIPPQANAQPNLASWNIPMGLPQNLDDQANLLDEINRLYGLWDVVNFLPEGTVNWQRALQDYNRQLQRMGLDVRTFPYMDRHVPQLSDIAKRHFAKLIWEKIGPEQTVGRQVELTFDLLLDMLRIEEIDPNILGNIANQLYHLEYVLLLARNNEVSEIRGVEFFGFDTMYLYPEARVAHLMAQSIPLYPVAEDDRSSRRGGLGMGGREEPATLDAMESMQTSGEDQDAIPEAVEFGQSRRLELELRASNEAALRFLYDLLNDEQTYRLENLRIQTIPDNQIILRFRLEWPYAVFAITMDFGNLVDMETGEPLALVKGQEELTRQIFEQQMEKRRQERLTIGEVHLEVQRALGMLPVDAESGEGAGGGNGPRRRPRGDGNAGGGAGN